MNKRNTLRKVIIFALIVTIVRNNLFVSNTAKIIPEIIYNLYTINDL